MLHSRHTVAIPPGETIKEQIGYLGMTQKEFAIRMGLSEKHISRLINGKVKLTQKVAQKLEYVVGPPAAFWNGLEAGYREDIIRVHNEIAMEEEEDLVKKIPYTKLSKLKWIPKETYILDKLNNLRSFFEVVDLRYLENLEKEVTVYPDAANNNKWAVSAFVQKVNIESRQIKVSNLNQSKLKKAINQIKDINFSNPDLSKKLKDTLKDNGVVLVILDRIEGTTFNGVSFMNNNHLVVGLVNSILTDKEYIISILKDLYNNLYGEESKESKIAIANKYLK